MKATKTLLGRVPVDSGTLCIIDPCCIEGKITEAPGYPTLKFDDFGGDGVFEVYEHRNTTGRVVRVTIEFPAQ